MRASQKRSSSALDSLSVGSIISVPGTGQGHGGGVEAVVHEPLGDVRLVHARTPLSGRRSMMHSWATSPVRPRYSTGKWLSSALGHVVGVEDRHLRGPSQALGAHHADVGPGDGQDAGAAPRRGRHGADGRSTASGHQRVTGQERRQMGGHADGTHARAAAAVGDAEGLVEVEVADVGAEVARPAKAHHGVHVGPVQVDLSALLVDDVADPRMPSSKTPWVEG